MNYIKSQFILLIFTLEEESLKVPDVSLVENSAEVLYGMIHQRYILTRQGLQQMVGIV
jgi:casein kinase II subunit beta